MLRGVSVSVGGGGAGTLTLAAVSTDHKAPGLRPMRSAYIALNRPKAVNRQCVTTATLRLFSTDKAKDEETKNGQVTNDDAKKETHRNLPPPYTEQYEARVYYPFSYSGPAPRASKAMQTALREKYYFKVFLDSHLYRGEANSVPLALRKRGVPSAKWPVEVRVPGKEDAVGRVEAAAVDFFESNVGIASFAVCGGKKGEPKPLQSLLNVLRALHDNEEMHAGADAQIPIRPQELMAQLISEQCTGRSRGWFPVDKASKLFIFVRATAAPDPTATEAAQDDTPVASTSSKDDRNGSSADNNGATHEDVKVELGPWDKKQMRTALYALSHFTKKADLNLNEQTLDKFDSQNCYLRWSTDQGGLWIGVNSDGGAAIQFPPAEESAKSSKSSSKSKAESGQTVHHYTTDLDLASQSDEEEDFMAGPSAMPLQLAPVLLYQKTYLQGRLNRVRSIISRTGDNSLQEQQELADELKRIEGSLLRFKLRVVDPVSESQSAQELFQTWKDLLGADALKDALSGHVADLAGYYSGLSASAQQRKLDTMTIVISFLGASNILLSLARAPNLPLSISAVIVSLVLSVLFQKVSLSEDPTRHPIRAMREALPDVNWKSLYSKMMANRSALIFAVGGFVSAVVWAVHNMLT
eukprot:jgi/Chlat1/278/Chrsp1S03168